LAEHCAWWAEHQGQRISGPTMWRAIRRVGWTRKKRSVGASERDEDARARWREQLSRVDVRRLVFVDESGTPTALARRYGWAPRGRRAHAQVPRHHGRNTTRVVGLSGDGLQAPWTVEGARDGPTFAVDVREVLAPTLRPGPLVILDNLRVHTADTIRQAIEARGCERRFLPASSPDLTPIEPAFSKIKAVLRRLAARSREALLDALATALAAVTPEDAHGWFTHAGYSPLAQSS
jgi:transposase